jgi:integrase
LTEISTHTSLLTELASLRKLCEGDSVAKKSQGAIRAKGRCPICREKFEEVKGIGFVCLEHKTVPKKVYVDLPWKSERIRIFSDKTGKPLDTYSRAEEVLKHLHYEITNHVFDPSKYVAAEVSKFWTVNLLKRFEEHKLKTTAPSSTADLKRKIKIAGEFFKNQDVREIRKLDIINYQEHCESVFTWKPKTLKDNLNLFKTFLYYLKNDLELIDRIPTFPEIEVPEPQVRWVQAKDQVTLYEKVPDEDKPIIGFLMLHGCRPGEARALRCKDVDLETGSISIHATFSDNVYREKRKGKRSRPYTVAIHPEASDFIAGRVRESHPEAFLFVNPRTGNCYHESALKKIWNKVRNLAGISGELRLYDASRHSFASQLINSGVSLFTVSKLLGHSSTTMTEKYSHANLENLRVELSKISLKKKESVTNLSLTRNYKEKQ